MSKGKLLFSLEGLGDGINDEVVTDDEFDAAMLAVMEDEKELEEEIDELDDIDDLVEEAEGSVERLESIAAAITKHGLSAGMMAAADPDGELVAAGILGSYEELGDIPVKDETATAAVEGIAGGIAKIITGYLTLFTKAAKMYIAYFISVGRAFKSQQAALLVAGKKLKSVPDINEDKFKARSIRTLSKADFDKTVTAADKVIKAIGGGTLVKVLGDLEKSIAAGKSDIDQVKGTMGQIAALLKPIASDDVAAALGISIAIDADNFVTISTSKSVVPYKKAVAGEIGWAAKDAQGAIASATKIVASADVVTAKIKALAELCKTYSSMLKTITKKAGEYNAEQKAAFKYTVNSSNRIIGISIKLIQATERSMRKVSNSALNVTSAAIKSKK